MDKIEPQKSGPKPRWDTIPSELSQLISARSDDDVYQAIVDTMDALFSADNCMIALKENDSLVTVASEGMNTSELSDTFPIASSIPGNAYSTAKSCVIDDLYDVRCGTIASTDASANSTLTPGPRSLMCVPLMDVGMLILSSNSPEAFSASDLETVERIAHLGAVALERTTASDILVESDIADRFNEVRRILAHDLKSPITVAYGRFELAKATGENSQFAKGFSALDRIKALIETAETLIRTGKPIEELTWVDLEEIVQQTWEGIESKGASLEVETSGTLRADERCLRQLLGNLLRNSINHGGPNVSIRGGLIDDGFYIEDDGKGIPHSSREIVFESGYTTLSTHAGYGLAIVQWLVESHNWSIDVVDGDDGGARFEIRNVEYQR